MTWNEQNKASSILDTLEGTVEEWYDQVDGLLKASDSLNKKTPGLYKKYKPDFLLFKHHRHFCEFLSPGICPAFTIDFVI